MRRLLFSLTAMMAVLALSLTAAPRQASTDRQLAAAKHKATFDGDLKGAIALYRQIVAEAGGNRALAAQALVGMAECYQQLGDIEAQKIYREILDRYGDQTAQASIARQRLDRTAASAPVRGDRAVWTGKDVDLFGTISPDGRYLTYVDWPFGNVMLRDLMAGTSRPLTGNRQGYEDGSPDFSAISSDGTRAAYGWYQSTGAGRRAELRIVPLDEPSLPRTQTIWSSESGGSMRPFQWSHDDKWIAVLLDRADRTSQLALLGVDGTVKELTSLGWRGTDRASFSPDSRYLAYDAAAAGGTRHEQIRIIAADASRQVVAFEDPSANTVMGWSADGRHVLFASDRSGALALWALPVRDGKPDGDAFVVRTDLPSTWSLGMTRAGTMYVWKSSGALYVAAAPLDVATGQAAATPVFQRFIESRGRPSWSADGKALLYISCGPSGSGPCRIFVWSADSNAVREIPHPLGYVGVPRLSPDHRLVVTNGTDVTGRRGVHIIDAASGETRALGGLGQVIDWSADGRAFYHLANRSGRRWLVERQVDADAGRDVVAVPSECQNSVRISPDRTTLGCTARVDSNRTTTFLVWRLDAGSPRVVFRVGEGEGLSNFWSWLPDSRGAILSRTDARGTEALWHVPLEGAPRKLDIDLSKWTDDGHFHVQPDGRHLAFVANAGEPGAEIWALENILPRAPARR